MPNQILSKKDIAMAFKYFRELKRSPKLSDNLFETEKEKRLRWRARF